MKIAYLTLTHKNPELLKRKIEFLSSEDCAFFIHVDKKHDIDRFSSIKGRNIFFSEKRIPVYWAEYSMLDAMLILLRQALAGPQKFDYFVLSTGTDYPLRSKEYIHDFFSKNKGREFISAVKMTNHDGCLTINQINTLRIPSSKPFQRVVTRIVNQSGLVRRDYRKHLGKLEPFSGNTGWALTRDACLYILDFVRKNRSICRYFGTTFTPDEMMFHTILGNSIFKPRMSRHLTFEDWGDQAELLQGSGARYWLTRRLSNKYGHPAWLNRDHIAFFAKKEKVVIDDVFGCGEVLFARKFSDNSLDLVQLIEDLIRQREEHEVAPAAKQSASGVQACKQARQTYQTVNTSIWQLAMDGKLPVRPEQQS